MKISQKMIAELSGVSRGTVDRVIHGKPNVKPETREKVLDAINKLDYTPNMVGRALAFSKREFSICAAFPDNAFFSEIKAGILAAVRELNDYNLSVSFVVTNEKNSAEIISELDNSGSNAFMLAVADSADMREWIDRRADGGIPVITFNTDVKDCKRLCFVGQDLYRSGRIAASLMLKMIGNARGDILVVTGSNGYLAHRERVRGFNDVMDVCGKDIRVVEVLETNDDGELLRKLVTDALKRYPRVDGIYVAAGDTGEFADVISETERHYHTVVNDLLPRVRERIESGVLDFTILQDPFEQGYRPVRLLFDCLFGGRLPENEFYYTNNTVVTQEVL